MKNIDTLVPLISFLMKLISGMRNSMKNLKGTVFTNTSILTDEILEASVLPYLE